jgi:hypothetical protein
MIGLMVSECINYQRFQVFDINNYEIPLYKCCVNTTTIIDMWSVDSVYPNQIIYQNY